MSKTSTSIALAQRIGAAFACAALFAGAPGAIQTMYAQAPVDTSKLPHLEGTWDGTPRARPVNSETVPWGKDNFPVLNERALAYQKVFDEALSPKYDCQPASSPAIQDDPYAMQVAAMARPRDLPV